MRKPEKSSIAGLKERAAEAGLKEGTPEYRDFMARGGVIAPVTNVNIDQKALSKFEEAFAEGDAKIVQKITETGLSAQNNLARLQSIENLLANMQTGGLAAAKDFAGRLGIKTEGLSEIQAFRAAVKQLVPGQREPGSGTMSDKDVNLYLDSLPALINQPGGNAIIIDTIKKINEYDLEGARIVNEMRAGNLTRAEAFTKLQNRPNPLAGQILPEGVQSSSNDIIFTPEEQAIIDKYNQ
jgi:hypothetical protein